MTLLTFSGIPESVVVRYRGVLVRYRKVSLLGGQAIRRDPQDLVCAVLIK